MPAKLPMLEFWYQAKHEQIGLIIETTDRHRLMNELYKARTLSGDESLNELSICWVPIDGQLWIIHKTIKIVKEQPDVEEGSSLGLTETHAEPGPG